MQRVDLCDHAEKMTLQLILCAGFLLMGGWCCEGGNGGSLGVLLTNFPAYLITLKFTDVVLQTMPNVVVERSRQCCMTGLCLRRNVIHDEK